jgi:hypothetical protein
MTPKRLGIAIAALVALWSLVGPAETPHFLRVPGLSGVVIAHAGDPDQYTNKPAGSAFKCGADSVEALPRTPDVRGGHKASSTISFVLQVLSYFLWGKGTVY